MTSVGWMIVGRRSRKQSRWPQGFQQDRYIVIFFRITDKGHCSGCSELILTHTAVVVDNFEYLGFVIKIERFQPDLTELWGGRSADISSSPLLQGVCELQRAAWPSPQQLPSGGQVRQC